MHRSQTVISDGLGLQQLGAGLGFPDSMVSDKVPGPLVLQQRISTKSESSEASNVFIKREEKSVWIDTRSDSRREPLSGALLTVWTTFMGHFFWVSFGQSFWFAWFRVHIWYTSGSSQVCTHISQSRWSLLKRHLGRASLDITHLFGLQGGFLCMCGQRGLLTSRMRDVFWAGPGLLP